MRVVPQLRVVELRACAWLIKCPLCGDVHNHSREDGPRLAHCTSHGHPRLGVKITDPDYFRGDYELVGPPLKRVRSFKEAERFFNSLDPTAPSVL
jgi:hypothetical protein